MSEQREPPPHVEPAEPAPAPTRRAAKSMALIWFVLVLVGLSCGVGVVTIFGSKTRAIFGASANALANTDAPRPRPAAADGGAH